MVRAATRPTATSSTSSTPASIVTARLTSPSTAIRCVTRTSSRLRPHWNMRRCAATGATSNATVVAEATRVDTYTTRWNVSMAAKRSMNDNVSRNAKRICTPVCATRSSCSSSVKLRSARCSGASARCRMFHASS